MTKELKAWEALREMMENGATVIDGELRSEWTWPHCNGYGLDEFCGFAPFTIKPKTSKLTAEMVVKASRGAKVYQLSNPDWILSKGIHGGGVTMRCVSKGIIANKIDFDADDWVME